MSAMDMMYSGVITNSIDLSELEQKIEGDIKLLKKYSKNKRKIANAFRGFIADCHRTNLALETKETAKKRLRDGLHGLTVDRHYTTY